MNPSPIVHREVAWSVGDIPVHATITAPSGPGRHPGVLLVAGSGPTDRDWCSPLLPGTNGSAGLLATELALRGYVTLRYDKMGSGPHVRDYTPKLAGKIGMEAFREELASALGVLQSEQGVAEGDLYGVTNSEGAIHAVRHQLKGTRPRFRGLVLTGPPGRSVGEMGRSQLLSQGASLPNRDALIALYDAAIARFQAGEPANPDPSLPEGVRALLRALESSANLPFSRVLWAYRLPPSFARVREPRLVLIGKKDLQSDWRIDGGLLEAAAAGQPNVTFVYPENANHVLKHEAAPRESLSGASVGARYNAPDAVLDVDALRSILDWLDRAAHGPK